MHKVDEIAVDVRLLVLAEMLLDDSKFALPDARGYAKGQMQYAREGGEATPEFLSVAKTRNLAAARSVVRQALFKAKLAAVSALLKDAKGEPPQLRLVTG
jgi:hypothetical protein